MSKIEEHETKFGWVLEYFFEYEDEKGFWEIVGMFTSHEKLTEWMKIRGFKEMPKEYRVKETVIDEGPYEIYHTRNEGYILDSDKENMTDDEVMEYIMESLENRDKFQEDNV
jgi:hypothetical protein